MCAEGPLFKAMDAREREKEVQRLQREAAEWQHKAGVQAHACTW